LLEVEVGGLTPGVQHDKLVMTGSAAIAGQLDVPIVNGYVPQPGDSITILNAANVSGEFAAVYVPDLATVNPNVAIQVTRNAADVQLQFVATVTTTQFASDDAVSNWDDAGTWNTGVEPDSRHVLTLQNSAGVDQIVAVENDDATAHELVVDGDANNTMTLSVKNGRTLSTTADTTVDDDATLELGSTTSKGRLVGRRLVIKKGGKLKGNGTLGRSSDLGNEIRKKTSKRNILAMKNLNSGVWSPGYSVGIIELDGDYEQDADGALEMELASPTSFDKFVVTGDATLGGTLAISLLDYIPQSSASFDIFDWETVTGTFDTIHLPTLGGGLSWNTDQLYTLGVLAIDGVLGDYNRNSVVDAADYIVWRKMSGMAGTGLAADGSGPAGLPDGVVDQHDYDLWSANFGNAVSGGGASDLISSVPEPGHMMLMLSACAWMLAARRRRPPVEAHAPIISNPIVAGSGTAEALVASAMIASKSIESPKLASQRSRSLELPLPPSVTAGSIDLRIAT
jgi:hypothetical protein